MAINMARGPNSIYLQCIAKASDTDKTLAGGSDTKDIIYLVNSKYGYLSMTETDVKRVFFENNYGVKKTDKALRQWLDLSYVGRVQYEGYWIILFMDHLSVLKHGKKTKGAE